VGGEHDRFNFSQGDIKKSRVIMNFTYFIGKEKAIIFIFALMIIHVVAQRWGISRTRKVVFVRSFNMGILIAR
jgi:hypothetical protein